MGFQKGPRNGRGAIPFTSRLPPCRHPPPPVSEKPLEQDQQWAVPEEAKKAPCLQGLLHPGMQILVEAVSLPLPLQPPATGLPPRSEPWAVKAPQAARETGIRTITPDGEISPYRRPPTSDWLKRNCSLGLILVASLELPKPWLSALPLKCRTFSVWLHQDDTQPGKYDSVGTCPAGAALRNWWVI